MSTIRYRVAVLDANAHLFEVRCALDDPAPDGQLFRLPAWTPGSYLIREFARNFIEVRAESCGGVVAIGKETKDTWRAAPCPGPLTVTARVYAFDLSVRAAYLDSTRGYFNGAALFLCPDGRENDRCTLAIVAPHGDPDRAWRIATTLNRVDTSSPANIYNAANYDELIDHPVEISDFRSAAFVVGGVPHEIALTGAPPADLDRLASDFARICEQHVDLFDAALPFERYLFLVNVGEGQGGLEHRSSTSLLVRRKSLPLPGMTDPNDDYVSLLGLASHEYFHAWNVKRLKPAAFSPYDLARENYTRQLWVFEGVTSYYDDLALVRCGAIPLRTYLELIGRSVTSMLRTPGRQLQSIADASFDAWIKFYRQDENTPNAGISYYLKGSLVALALDLTLRADSRGSLDAVMRSLWKRYGATQVGVPEDGIETAVAEVAGRSLDEFFARYVRGTEDPPLAELLSRFGIRFNLRAPINAGDVGGNPARNGSGLRCTLGAKVAADLKLFHVYSGGPAERAGLAPGDAVVALDGVRASSEVLASLLERRAPGDRIHVHAFRRDELRTFDVDLAAAPLDTCYLTVAEDPTAEMLRLRVEWLGATGATAAPTD